MIRSASIVERAGRLAVPAGVFLAPFVAAAGVLRFTDYPLVATRTVTTTERYGLLHDGLPLLLAWVLLWVVGVAMTMGYLPELRHL